MLEIKCLKNPLTLTKKTYYNYFAKILYFYLSIFDSFDGTFVKFGDKYLGYQKPPFCLGRKFLRFFFFASLCRVSQPATLPWEAERLRADELSQIKLAHIIQV